MTVENDTTGTVTVWEAQVMVVKGVSAGGGGVLAMTVAVGGPVGSLTWLEHVLVGTTFMIAGLLGM
jgi:hypothetical protein